MPSYAKYGRIPRLDCPRIRVRYERFFRFAYMLQLAKPVKHFILDSAFIADILRKLPIHSSAVYIARISRLIRVILVGIIIHLPYLIAAVKHRNPRLHKHIRVKHQVKPQRLFHRLLILLKSGFFHAAHGRSRAAETRIARHRISVVELAPACAAPGISLEIVIQIFLVAALADSVKHQNAIVKPPAYIIMAAQIIQKYIFLRQRIYNVKLPF